MSLESLYKNIELQNEGVKQLEGQMNIHSQLMDELKKNPNLTEEDKARIRTLEAYSKNAFAKASKHDMSFQDILEKMKNI